MLEICSSMAIGNVSIKVSPYFGATLIAPSRHPLDRALWWWSLLTATSTFDCVTLRIRQLLQLLFSILVTSYEPSVAAVVEKVDTQYTFSFCWTSFITFCLILFGPIITFALPEWFFGGSDWALVCASLWCQVISTSGRSENGLIWNSSINALNPHCETKQVGKG